MGRKIALGLIFVFGIFWFYKSLLSYFNMEPGFLVPSSVFLFCLILFFAIRIFTKHKAWNILLLAFSVSVSLLFLEWFLSGKSFLRNYFEQNMGFYQSIWKPSNPNSHYHLWTPDVELESNRLEFNYKKTTNSLGICTSEYPLEKDSSEFRIIVLGDSFTEGVGAPRDSVFPVQLETLLKKEDGNIRVLNAGVSGSDPVFGFKLLQDKLIVYEPDLVIFMVNYSDISGDFPVRGGFKRFLPNNRIKFRKPIFNERLFATSFIVRYWVYLKGYNSVMLPRKDEKLISMFDDGMGIIDDLRDSMEIHLDNKNIKTRILYHPMNSTFFSMSEEAKFLNNPSTAGLDVFTLKEKMPEISSDNYLDYYWEKDGHHNSKGYGVLARAVKDVLLEENLVKKNKE